MKSVIEIDRPSRLPGWVALLSGISHRTLVAALMGLMAGFPVRAQSGLPTGGTVVQGGGTITQSGNTLNINQPGQTGIYNFQTFSIGRDNVVNFNQPNTSASSLARVVGTEASMIRGALNAPGSVLLVNPNGITIGKSGVINVGSFAASTLDIKDSDYLAGRYKFTGNGGSAGVINRGTINVSDGGFAALLGGQVSNRGTITARLGKVGLGAGELVTLDFAGDGFLSVAVPSSQLGNLVSANGALVTNSGKIRADGGTVMLSAATAANVLRDAVNVPGSIRANSVGTHNGKIVIGGGQYGKVNVSGKLAAKSKTGKGGDIVVTGKDIKLAGATIDASGKTGGGNINIGGGRQGQGPLQRAETLSVDAATTIKADAKDIGKGGNVVLWSDVQTTFEGNISARGGANGGNGGEAEVSGKQRLSYGGSVDLRAVNGQTGTLLLDPTDFKIAAAGGDATGASIAATLATANVAINSNSGATGTNGDILVNDTITWTSANSLTLNAVRSIAVNAAITGTNGALNLNAGQGNAAGTITQTAAISVNTLTLSSTGGSATLSSFDNSITNLGTVSLGTGALSLSNNKSLTVNGVVGATGGVTLSALGALTLSNSINAGASTVSLTASGAGNNISQTTGSITAGVLVALGDGNASFGSANNSVGFLVATLSGATSALTFGNAIDVGVLGVTAKGGITMATTGAISITNGAMDAGASTVSLTTGGTGKTITQDAAGVITAGSLTVNTGDSNVSLDTATNAVSGLGTVFLGNGAFALKTAKTGNFTVDGSTTTANGGIAVTNTTGNLVTSNAVASNGPIALSSTTGNVVTGGSVNSSGGSTSLTATSGSITLGGSLTGAGVSLTSASTLTLNQNIFGNAGNVVLTATGAGSNITQTAGRVQGAGLLATALNGSVDITAGAASNSVATIAGRSSGTFAYTAAQSTALTIGTVSGTSGIVSSNGNVAVRLTNPATTMTVGQAVTASNGDVTLQSGGNLVINTGVTANTGTGTIGLTSTSGEVAGIGVLTAAKLGVSASSNIDLRGTNNIQTFAAKATNGFVVLFNAGGFALDQVGSINGVTAGSDVVLATLTAPGNITQTANGKITTTGGGGLVLQASNGSIVLDQANSVSGSFAVTGTPNGGVTLRNTGTLNIGTAGTATGITISGVLMSTSKTLSLTSDTGNITQTSAITAGTLQGQTTGQNMTLTNAGNSILNLGTTSLGAGQLSLFSGASSLTVSGIVSATGGVSLQTPSQLSVNAAINAGSGNVSLTQTTDTNGFIITQGAGGVITANSLTANAAGQVALGVLNNVASVTGSSGNGQFAFLNSRAGGLTVTGITSTGGRIVVLENTGDLIVSGALNSNGQNILLASGGNLALNAAVTATGASVGLQGVGGINQNNAGIITASHLVGLSNNGTITLTQNNVVGGNIGFTAGGSVSFTSTSGFNVGGISAVETLSINPGIRTSAAGSTTLNAGGAITQAAGATDIISTGTLNLTTSGNANVTLNNASNAITNLGTVSTGTGWLVLRDTGSLTVTGAVNAGIVDVTTTGTITIDNKITASGVTGSYIWLTAVTPSGGPASNITQTANGGLVTPNLELDATGGSVNATAGAANNNITTLAGRSSGDFAYADGNTTALLIGTVVGATPGIVSTNGSVSISATRSGAQMQVAKDVTASNGNVTLQSNGTLFIGANTLGAGNGTITANNATGVITLTSATGSVQELIAGTLTAAAVAASAGGSSTNIVDLRNGTNVIGRFAANAGGYVLLLNGGAVAIDQVGALNGITAFGDVAVLTTAAGDITQTAAGTIISGGSLLVNATNGNITLNSANSVAGNFATGTMVNGNVTLRNGGNLNVGAAGIAGLVTDSGIAINGTLSLNSNGGSVTQSTRIIAGTIQGSTGAGGSMTLTDANNNFAQVGPTNLGTGALTLSDSTGGMTVTGAVSASGGISLSTTGALVVNNTVNAGAGSVSLNATGAISQNSSGVITAGSLSATAGTTVSLTALNAVDAVTGSSSGGFSFFSNNAALTVNSVTDAGGQIAIFGNNLGNMTVSGAVSSGGSNILLATGGTLTINAAVTAGLGSVALEGDTGIAQGAGGVITAANLVALSTAGSIALTANNAVSNNIGFNATSGSVSFTNTSGFIVGGISTVNFGAFGNFGVTPGIRTAVAGSTTLTAGGAVTQATGATDLISTGTLNLTTSDANATLNNANNNVVNLGAVSLGNGRLILNDVGGLTVTGAVNAGGGVTATTSGTIAIENVINAGSSSLQLTATGAGSITQTATGGVQGNQVVLSAAGGSVDVTAGAAKNRAGTLYGLSSGDFAFTDGLSTSFMFIGSAGVNGIVSTNGNIAVSATNGTVTLYTIGAVTASKDVTLQAAGDLFVGDGTNPVAITANGTTGVISLSATGGSVIESLGGGVSGAKLAANAATNIYLASATLNTIGTFAAKATNGYVLLFNNGAIALDTVGSTNGVTAGTDVVLAANAGNITQTANGKITTANGGLVLQAQSGSITLDQANAVSGNFVVTGMAAGGDVTLRNTGNLNIGTVAPAAFGGGSFSGVQIGANKVLTLRSDNGAITQGSNLGDRVIAGEVRGQTTDKDMTLTHAGNQFGSVGPTTLGTGALSLLNSVGGLTVTGAVSAGSVSLTTTAAGGAISQTVAGTITTGTLALTTNDGNATLDFANNAVSSLGPVALGAGALRLYSGVDLTVAGAVSAGGGVTISSAGFITTAAGGTITTNNTEIALTAGTDVTIGDTVTSNGGVIALATGANGTLTVNAPMDAGAGNVFLTADNMTIAGAVSNTGSVNIATVTAGRAITLGDAPTPAGLVLDNASGELNQFIGMSAFNVGKDRSGTTTAGAIQLGQATIPTDAVNLFTTAGVTQVNPIVFIGATGAGTLSITAVDTVDLRPGVAAGTITGSVSGAGKHFIAYGGGSNINIGTITTNGGEIAVGNNNGTLAVVGDLTSNGGHINAFSTGVLTLGANLDARGSGGADGSIGLVSVAGINQTAGGLKGKDLLAFLCNVCAPGTGNITLDSTTNEITRNVTLVNLTGGNINFTNDVGYTVGAVHDINYASIGVVDVAPYTGLSSGSAGIRTAGTNATVTLTAGGDIAQATAATDIVETNTLVVNRITGRNVTVTLDNYDSVNNVFVNKVANLGNVNIGQGDFTLYNNSDITITGTSTVGGRYDVMSDGNVTLAAGASINTSSVGGDVYLTSGGCGCVGGALALNGDINAGAGAVYLLANTITQAPTGAAIVANTLNVQAVDATLNSSTNAFSIVNAQVDNNFSATTSISLTIGSVGVLSFAGNISLTATGATSDITVPGGLGGGSIAGNDITLNAGRDVVVNGAVFGNGTVSATATRDILVNGCGCGGLFGADVALDAGRDITIDTGVAAIQTVTMLANRNITDTSNAQIAAASLRAVAGRTFIGGAVDLSNGTNSTNTIVGSASGNFSYKQDGDLTIGTIVDGIISYHGVGAGNGVTINAGTGRITIDTLARVVANSEIVLAGSTFKNNRGSDAVASSAGRWLIYANAPGTAADYNGLNSGNTAIWGTTYPAPVAAAGNRYVFAMTPTVTLSPDNVSKVYGQVPVLTYSATGLQQGVAGAYLSDTLATATAGAPVLTSAGSAATASVAGGPYLITIALGSLTGLNGYNVSVGGTGLLTVTPATLTYVADSASRQAGSPNPPFTGTVTGFVNGETVGTATTGAAAWNSPANTSSTAGSYGIFGSGLSAANYVFVQAASNATALTVTPPPNSATSQVTPPSNKQSNPSVNITYQNNPTGLANISFTTGARVANAPTNVNTAGNPDAANRTNNGFTYAPISQFDANQYAGFQLPDYADKASIATIFTMISRAAQTSNAADFMIDGFWTGNDATWAKGSDGKPVANRVTFSDGADKTVSPAETNGFPVEAGKTDVLAMLGKGPVILGGSGTPAAFLLAIKASDDGKGIIANDPISGRQVLLSYDAGTKTVGGVAGIFDAKTQKFVALSEAAATQQAGEPALKADSLAPLNNFVPATFFAVTVK